MPIALGGSLHFPHSQVDPDTFVLRLPMSKGRLHGVTLAVFIGGLSTTTGIIMWETVALTAHDF